MKPRVNFDQREQLLTEVPEDLGITEGNMIITRYDLLTLPREETINLETVYNSIPYAIFTGKLESFGMNAEVMLNTMLQISKSERDFTGSWWFLPIVGDTIKLVAQNIWGRRLVKSSSVYENRPVDYFLHNSEGFKAAVYNELASSNYHKHICEFGFILIRGDEVRTIYFTLPYFKGNIVSKLSPEMEFIGHESALDGFANLTGEGETLDDRNGRNERWWTRAKTENVISQRIRNQKLIGIGEVIEGFWTSNISPELKQWLRGGVDFATGYYIYSRKSSSLDIPPSLHLHVDRHNWIEPGNVYEKTPNHWELSSNLLRFHSDWRDDLSEFEIDYTIVNGIPEILSIRIIMSIPKRSDPESRWRKVITINQG